MTELMHRQPLSQTDLLADPTSTLVILSCCSPVSLGNTSGFFARPEKSTLCGCCASISCKSSLIDLPPYNVPSPKVRIWDVERGPYGQETVHR